MTEFLLAPDGLAWVEMKPNPALSGRAGAKARLLNMNKIEALQTLELITLN
jgi:hypothetical protein